ncbi:MAG: hypothetical protein K1060chlam4_00844 [Candidatus Anoxychlamydiales bacterium]|nr:hypothetical protein [Candidatus Anoxychlamydiales bacterium]
MSAIQPKDIINMYGKNFDNKTSEENEREVNLFISMKGRPGYEARDGKMFLTEWSNPLQDKKMFGISLTALGNAFVDVRRTIASDEDKTQIVDSEVCAGITKSLWIPKVQASIKKNEITSKLNALSADFENRQNSINIRDKRIAQIYRDAAQKFESQSKENNDEFLAILNA